MITAAVLLAAGVLVRFPISAGSVSSVQPGAPGRSRTENVVLITLDGARAQEIFGGLDLDVLRSTLPNDRRAEQTRAYERYWAATPEAARVKLMPFFWTVIMAQHGSIAGNLARGSSVRVTNRHRFSYPGYAELLLGEAHDDAIDSNDKRRNPYPTVLEFLKQRLHLDKERVAAFASWDTFDWIVEHEAGTIASNAGFDAYEGTGPAIDLVNRLQVEAPTPWDGARHDAYTFELAMAHLKRFKPRVLYLAFNETDDWAHDGRYDRVLDALHATDGYLRELWTVLQQDAAYRDRTTVVITADHARGNTTADWRDHGSKIAGAEQIWMAFAGPDWPRRGEWRDSATIYQNQVAATLAQSLGLDYGQQHPNASRPIAQLLSR
ncbi:MAG: hypothetical protein DMF97_02305 [Acidobacteria bacterium]|nr:MAG: hypothetical protein DMF97_02305 [Acidobacteriota bacterium]